MIWGQRRSSVMNDVTSTLVLQVLDGAEPVTGTFRYRADDPWAVTATFTSKSAGTVTWTFARELLVHGRYEPVGQGDVHIWPCLGSDGAAVVLLELDPGEDGVLLEAATRELSAFVDATLALVPLGQESRHLDVDAGLTRLLAQSLNPGMSTGSALQEGQPDGPVVVVDVEVDQT